ncbi:MAG: alpha/beta hydrolase [Candidatus Heimdallarchaeaceae archaeon]
MRKFQVKIILSLVSFLLVFASITVLQVNDSALSNYQTVSMIEPNTGDTLRGKYYPGTVDVGLMVLEGFGGDHIAMKNILTEFAEFGFHLFAFDFSGHGQSDGSLEFDNAKTDRLANQTLQAKNEFINLSGLNNTEILMLGHSMGARVALQAVLYDPAPVNGLILLGTQLNLDFNAQSSFFTGTKDSELDWVQGLNAENPQTNVLMISGSWDDILPVESAFLLYEQLTGQQTTNYNAKFTNTQGKIRDLYIVKNLFHNYEIFSTRVMKKAKEWTVDLMEFPAGPINVNATIRRTVFWIIGALSLFSAIIFTILTFDPMKETRLENDEHEAVIFELRKFLWTKLLLWLGGLPIGALLCGLFILIPIDLPVFNLVYVGFIGGYGILLLTLYLIGKMPGVTGKMRFGFQDLEVEDEELLKKSTIFKIKFKYLLNKDGNLVKPVLALLAGAVIITLSSLFVNTGLWYIFPASRIFWLIVFSFFTAIGFYIGLYEMKMMVRSVGKSKLFLTLSTLIGLAPFFLLAILYLILGSFSGMLGSFNGIVILGLSITVSILIQKITKNDYITAFIQAFLLQILILPQGVLFAL